MGRRARAWGARWGTLAGGFPDSVRDIGANTPRGARRSGALRSDPSQPASHPGSDRAALPPSRGPAPAPQPPRLAPPRLRLLLRSLDFSGGRTTLSHVLWTPGKFISPLSRSLLFWDKNARSTGLMLRLDEKSRPKLPAESQAEQTLSPRQGCPRLPGSFSGLTCPLPPTTRLPPSSPPCPKLRGPVFLSGETELKHKQAVSIRLLTRSAYSDLRCRYCQKNLS